MNENMVEIKNLTKEYKMFDRKKDRLLETIFPSYNKHKTFKALNNLDLEIKKGEILGILGRNGAGKSTLLKIITGVVTQTSGEMKINGKISSLLELGTAFNMELTGTENIYQHGQVMGLSNEEIEKTKQDIIDFADIGKHLYQPVKTYSSGMFARLAFACAINVDPDILIVDEVLSVGDMAFQLKCFKKFEEFKNRGKTILFVTHSITDIIKNCTRAIILSDGKKIYDGNVKTAADMYKKIIVGIDIESEIKKSDEKYIKERNKIKENKTVAPKVIDNTKTWKENFQENPDLLTYGNGKAEIIDYGIFDKDGNAVPTVDNNEPVTIKMKVKFNEDIKDAIFAISIKDFNGLELAGANTDAYKVETGICKKDEIVIAEFNQVLPLAPNRYTISFGCTHFDLNGDLEVFDRKYDALFLETMALRGCLGLIDLKSEIKIKKENI